MHTYTFRCRASFALASFSLIAALTGVQPAAAALPEVACNALSPQRLALGDDYFTLTDDHRYDEESLHTDAAQVTRLLERLSDPALRSGSGHRETCLGTDGNSHTLVERFDLEDIEYRERARGGGLLSVFENRHTVEAPRQQRRTAGQIASVKIDLPVAAHWQVSEVGDGIVSTRRFRREVSGTFQSGILNNAFAGTGIPRGSALIQIDLGLRPVSGRGIELTETIYVNGHRSDFVLWHLTR